MPANGQKAAGASISNVFGSGFDQKLNALNTPVGVRGGDAEAQAGGFYGGAAPSTAAPATASAAPTKGSNSLFTGLCDALNQHQQSLVKNGTYEYADEYVIQFAPVALGSATVTPPGPVVYGGTVNQTPNTASAKLDPAKQQVNTNSQIWEVLAGTQIVQFIDQVMRGSSYIRDQQKAQIDAAGKQTKSNANFDTTAWYKISAQATQLKYDNKRNTHAYRMTYVVNTYAINQMGSPYFNDSKYRGAHKAYNYWFTGLNTQVLHYEQEYNAAYYITLNNDAGQLAVNAPPTGQDQFNKTFMASSEVRGLGQPGYVNNPADSAAAFLYSITDFQEVRLKIVGDPAWLQQGEIAVGVNAATFNFAPFNADGGINYDSSEVVFTLSFNRPTDYDFNTGIMNVNAANGQSKQTFAYIATSCRNTFSKGQFIQELVGKLLPLTATSGKTATNVRATTPAAPAASGSRDTKNSAAGSGYQDEAAQNADGNGSAAPSGYQNEAQQNADNGPATPLPAAPPAPATSSGDVAPSNTAPPPNASSAANADAALAAQTSAENAYYAAGSPQSGPIYEAYNKALNATDLAQTQAENAIYNTPGVKYIPAPYLGKELGAVPQPGGYKTVPLVPQVIAKDDS